MAPDAARAPPLELQGPPRYLRERGLTPSPAATAARRQRSALRATNEDSISAHSKKNHKKGRKTASHTPSSRALPTPRQAHHPPGHSRHSHDEVRKHSRSKQRGGTGEASEQMKDGKIEGAVSVKEEQVHGRGTVVAPALDALSELHTATTETGVTATPSAPAYALGEQNVEQTMLQSPQQHPVRNACDALSPVGLPSEHSRPTPGGTRLGGAAAMGGAASEADIRAPPPRARSPGHRRDPHSSLDPAGRAVDRVSSQTLLDGASGEHSHGHGNSVDVGAGVKLAVPVLSAHSCVGSACRVPAALGESGPPGPAAWDPAQLRDHGDAHAPIPHRHTGHDGELQEEGGHKWESSHPRRSSGVSASPFGTELLSAAQQPSHRPAGSIQNSSHRFGVPFSTSGAAANRAPPLSGVAATAAGGMRFSASQQLTGTSPILKSFVAESFNSYLPGYSTVLGSGVPTDSMRRVRAAAGSFDRSTNLLKKTKQDEAAVELEVAVLAEPVEELPPHDILERYDALLKRYETQRRRAASNNDVSDMAALFSLVVHITLPSRMTAPASEVDAEAVGGGKGSQQQQPVTIGDVKAEVTLRTGIPSLQQCLVYEAMSLQDALPVHLLLSADADWDDSNDADGNCLRLLCVPLKANAGSQWPSPRRRHSTIAAGASETRVTAALEVNRAEAGEDVDDLKSLLLLSPARRGVSTVKTAPPPPQQQQQLSSSTVEAAPSVRRGAVPFIFSKGTIASHTAARRKHSDAPGMERDAVALHIDRLRRRYFGDGSQDPSHGAAMQSSGNTRDYIPFHAPPRSRDDMLHAADELHPRGYMEHADPVVHTLQQRLLLTQLTAHSGSPANRHGARTAAGGDGMWVGLSQTENWDAAATLSDALIAALPAPPVRQSPSHHGGVAHVDEKKIATGPSAPAAAAARARFSVDPLPATTTAAAPTSRGAVGATGTTIPVLLRTPPHTQRSSPQDVRENPSTRDADTEDGGDGGVEESWLTSSHATAYSAKAMDKVEVALSHSLSTVSY
ncbi:hypothetical protein ABL78_7256 [Leptomonas seymouri]|uniref:Ubiquitin-like domain-containing protein n=1 Tax=Leptomonas seymouri TaxID=5684 RepID=A0A0N1HZU0_LEPSE|nr:hypothetical protein ABL78_7256 [Leptomonas seymouri]|eukprot:KPI83705.1 hypothetical protein ABL78_7256 [Leptomonas seymouri]